MDLENGVLILRERKWCGGPHRLKQLKIAITIQLGAGQMSNASSGPLIEAGAGVRVEQVNLIKQITMFVFPLHGNKMSATSLFYFGMAGCQH